MPTAAELQAAAAAAAQYTQTAEQAAMLNAAYRANQLPVLPQYAAGSGITQAQYEDAQNEAIKRQIAFSQPRNDVRQLSGEAARIASEYGASRNRVVGSQGVMYQGPTVQRNPYGQDNAAAIAWEVGRTGGATDDRMNVIAEREVVAAGGDPGFIRYATDIYQERPQFEREVLTTKTGERFENKEWYGVPIRMNLTKAEMAAGGGITDQNYGKYLRYDTESYQLNRLESGENMQFGIDTGVHKARGDFGGPWLKDGAYGGWRSGGGRIVGGKTVAGFGAEATVVASEATAKQPFVSARYKPEISTIENPSGKIFGAYIPGISEGLAFFEPKSKVTTTEKRTPMDPVTTFGEPYTEGDTTFYPSTTKSGDVVEKTTVATPIPGSSGFDEFESSIRKMLPSSVVGEKAFEIGSSANPFSTRFIGMTAGKEIAFGAMDVVGLNTQEARKTSASVVDATDIFKGQYESFYEHPTLAVGSYAAGAVFGTAFKAAGAIGGAARARMAPALISRGQSVRAVEMTGAGLWKTAQVGMAGIYAADLSGRATKGFTDLSPASVAPRARAMAAQEVYPMVLGFGAPDRAIKSVRTAELGYKQALLAGKGEPAGRLKVSVEGEPRSSSVGKYLELNKWNLDTAGMSLNAKPTYRVAPDTAKTVGMGWGVSEPTTTGRFDWYIRQPVTRVASRPIDLVKQDYRAFILEKTTPIKRTYIEDAFPEVPEGYTRIGHVTIATPELLSGIKARGLEYSGPGTQYNGIRTPRAGFLEHTSVDLTGQGVAMPSAPGATPKTWFKAAQDTYIHGKAGRNMFGDYSQYGPDILLFDVKPELYLKAGSRTGDIALSTGKDSYVGKLKRSQLENPVQITGGEKPGLLDYLSYKIDKPIAPEPSTIRISQRYSPTELGLQPVSTEYGAEIIRTAYGKQNTIGQTISKKLGIGRTPVAESPLLRTSESTIYQGGVWTKAIREPVGEVSPELSLKAYGKQKTLFESSASVMQEPHQYARYISEAKAMGLSRVYPTMPVNLRVKAFVQEHPSKFISDAKIMLWEPEMEISNINRASRVRLGDMFKGSPRPKGKSTLNIWGTQPQPFISRNPTAYPEPKTAETKTKGGQTLVSRTEMAQSSFPVAMQESGFRGGIVYPSGPSPIQRQRYVVTEEEEYYRLPPGIKSPAKQKQETIQSVMQVPGSVQRMSTLTMQQPFQITRQEQESRFKSDIFQTSRQDQRSNPELAFRSFQERIPARDIFEGTRQETRTIVEPRFDITQRFDQSQRTRTEQITTQITDEIIRIPPPPPPPPPPPGYGGGVWPGGGGNRQYGNIGVTQWRRENLVADMPYLARGMREIYFGIDAGSGSDKWFGGKKKRRKPRKK